ncbi:MAG: AgmX/PglI C-terminal domain-containing protein [Myxococcota bacterium]
MKTYCYLLLVAVMSVPLLPGLAAAERSSSLTVSQIRQVISRERAKVSRCYAKYAMKQKGADGKVQLHLIIKPKGKVASIKVVAPSVRGQRFANCVTEVAEDWRFPRAASETEVVYPFHFVHTNARGAGPVRRR